MSIERKYNYMFANDKKIEQPEDITIKLMDHQRTIVCGMIKRENNGFVSIFPEDKTLILRFSLLGARDVDRENTDLFTHTNLKINSNIAIFGDKVGSGKSISILSLILLRQNPPSFEHITYGSQYLYITDMTKFINVKENLIIVPHKLIFQWEKYISYFPTLNIFICHNDKKLNEIDHNKLNKYNIILISSKIYNNFFDKFINVKWSRIVIDEADNITFKKNTLFNSHFIWLISSNPSNLYSNQSISSLTSGTNNILLEYLTFCNDNKYIDQSCNLPVPNRYSILCDKPAEILTIGTTLPKQILNLVNLGKIHDVVKILNCNAGTTDNICQSVTGYIKMEINFINKKIEKINNDIIKTDEHSDIYNELILKKNKLTYELKRYHDRLESTIKKVMDVDKDTCPICFNAFNEPIIINCCNNIFCIECIMQNLIHGNTTCPFCKEQIDTKNINLISENVKNDVKICNDKITVLLGLLRESNKKKFVIFSECLDSFELIQIYLEAEGIKSSVLMGNSLQIKKTLNDFDKGVVQVILLNKKYPGTGLNLEMATDLIIYHRFDNEDQVIGRAQRYGRNEPLNVYYLLHDDENDSYNTSFQFNDSYYNPNYNEIM